MDKNISIFNRSSALYICIAVVATFIASWFGFLHYYAVPDIDSQYKIWGASYQIVAFIGAIIGFVMSYRWGGFHSSIGRAVGLFAIGLLLQVFGQSVNSYFNIVLHHEIPYPSLGDIGFMGSVFAYIAGAYILMGAAGLRISFKSLKGKFFVVGLPLIVLVSSYMYFLRGYEFDWASPVKIVLDFAYPLGQALYVSIALIALSFSKSYLGGLMKKPIIFFLLALIVQYLSDFTFLYQANLGTWYAGGINDFMYFMSYCLMTCALIYVGGVFKAIKTL